MNSESSFRIWIEHVQPQVNAGQYPIKRTVGESVKVTADIFTDGHDQLTAVLAYRPASAEVWREAILQADWNDAWSGEFHVTEEENYFYRVSAWINTWSTLASGLRKKFEAGHDVTNELLEAGDYVELTAGRTKEAALKARLRSFANRLIALDNYGALVEECCAPSTFKLMETCQERRQLAQFPRTLMVQVDRERARFGSWYEMFPRSAGITAGKRGANFREAAGRLPEIAAMGFDVLYLPPIHPIGLTNRKGRNNALTAEEGDVGSPWAIGGPVGGHKAIETSLGDLEDFQFFLKEAQGLGIEIALDLALQCSPDHPYLREHPEWFRRRPDNTIHYAENPPKKYEDIHPFNFECDDWRGLWNELLSIVRYWVSQGVNIFRVDNPHTKPLKFWEWLIAEVRRTDPQVLFLSEAFTRPKIMYALAKLGFHQSYTYFTWRNSKSELLEYVGELTSTEVREYFRPNFFTNTPDILNDYLQHGGRAAFEIRLILAATLASNYGIYSGFELCESTAVPGTEEYQDSEKYQLKFRNWDSDGNIKPLIRQINQLRRDYRALQFTSNLKFCQSSDAHIIAYSKSVTDEAGRSETILAVVNLDPHRAHEAMISLPGAQFGLSEQTQFGVRDLLSGEEYLWRQGENYVRLDPATRVAHLLLYSHP